MRSSFVFRLLQTLTPWAEGGSVPSGRSSTTSRSSGSPRVEVSPPARRLGRASWRERIGAWLASGLQEPGAAPSFDDSAPAGVRETELATARAAFQRALDGITTREAVICVAHIRAARSMHELWHLRAVVFNLVSCSQSQREAADRVSHLDEHFSRRVRRPGTRATTARARPGLKPRR